MFVIVDGYNLLRLAEKVDITLCRMISQYLRIIGATGVVVFDGIGPPDKQPFENLPRLEVIFSGRKADADSLIVNKIGLDSAPKGLLVVSSDRELQTAAKRRKAVPVKSHVFFAQLVDELSKKRKPSQEPPEKRTGITDGETEEWLRTFGFKK
jgi:predicted RNA-binding protein with PIN domain